jgi:HPt (histidine-containing phosphotransfer) domain-containing protein
MQTWTGDGERRIAGTMTAQKRSETADRPVDLAHLARQTFGSRDLEREVLRLFLGQSTTLIQRITAAEGADQRFAAAHTLKGSARGIGAHRVARLAEAAERADLVPGDAVRILGELGRAVDEANGFIREVLED